MKKIKKTLQNILKKKFQFLFKILYGKVIYIPRNLKYKEITIKKIQSKFIRKFDKKNYRIYKIKNGRVYTDNVENVAVINKNIILDNISYQQILGNLLDTKKNSCLKKGTPRLLKKYNKNILSLVQGASGVGNYYHWLFDMLPKIKLFLEVYNSKEIDFLYCNKLKKFQKDTLIPLGISNKVIIDSEKYRHIKAKNLFCTDHPSYFKGYIETESKKIPKWIVVWLKSTFLKYRLKFKCNKKIFIDRSGSPSNHCQFINNNEIMNFLKKKGFSSYRTEKLSFYKKIYLFYNAKVVVGAHGAGLANLAFCREKTKVIEIRPKNRLNSLYKRISDVNNLNYHLIKTQVVKDSKLLQKGDIKLEISDLAKYLN